MLLLLLSCLAARESCARDEMVVEGEGRQAGMMENIPRYLLLSGRTSLAQTRPLLSFPLLSFSQWRRSLFAFPKTRNQRQRPSPRAPAG